MILIAYSLSAFFMILMPVVFAILLRRKFRVPWLMFLVGTLTFLGSQVVHLPLNNLLADIGLLPETGTMSGPPLWRTALILGLTAGLCEELARALGYWLLPRYRRFEDGAMMGLGHGGIESMIIGGVFVAATVTALLPMQGIDLETLELTTEQAAILHRQLEIFTTSPLLALTPMLERLIAICAHVIFSLLVLQTFVKRNGLYLLIAIAYHAVIDAVLVYSAQFINNPWLLIAIFAVILLPGIIWVWRISPKNEQVKPHQVSRFSDELSTFFYALKKELLQQWRTKRLIVVLAIFVLFGLTSPLIANFTPQLLSSLEGAEQFAELIPEPTAADGVDQYIKNLTQFGFILAILLGMGAVAGEKEKGTAAMILSKPMSRWAFILSKFGAQTIVYTIGFLIATLGAYYYTIVLFGSYDFGDFIVISMLLELWLLIYVAITLLGSTIGKTTGAAAGISLAGSVLILLAGNIPQVGMLFPSGLTAWATQIGSGVAEEVMINGGAVALAIVIIVMCLLTAVGVFEKQEL
jgi:ABC-2 type transport system permease protein